MGDAMADPLEALATTVAVLATTVAVLAGEDRSGWTGVARSEVLVRLLGARERLDALIVAVTGEWDRDRSWELDGARSPVAWLAHRAPLTRQDASSLVRTARHVQTFEQTAKALDTRDITTGDAQISAQAAKHRAETCREHETVLLDVARRLPVAGFRQVMQYWKACAHDAAANEPPGDDTNYLDITTTFEGVGHLDGRLDPVAVKTLMDRLDALEPPDPTDGPRPPRTVAQRRAAALMRLVHGEQPPATTIDILVDHQTFAGRPPADPTAGCCELVGHGPITPMLARTLACDAAIGRIVMRGDSEVLDLGRRTRLITPALRRSLAARDRTCVEPGCDIPAHWCDAHHIIPWHAHGPTTLDNLERRCRRHHLTAHRRLEADIAAIRRRE
jgi:hypothetical protein